MMSLFGPPSPPSSGKNRKKAHDGKGFELEVGHAFGRLGAEHINTGDPTPGCDRRACVPFEATSLVGDTVGVSVLVECKELRSDRFDFKRISDRERDFLTAHERAGGLSFLLIKRIKGSKVRCWGWPWQRWLAHVEGATSQKSWPVTIATAQLDGLELLRHDGHWDLTPLLRPHGQVAARKPLVIGDDGSLNLYPY